MRIAGKEDEKKKSFSLLKSISNKYKMSECKKCVEEGNWPACNNFVAAAFKKNQCKTCFHAPSDHGIEGINEEKVQRPTPTPKSTTSFSRNSQRKEDPPEEIKKPLKTVTKTAPVKTSIPVKTPIKKVEPKKEEVIIVEDEIIDDGEIIEDDEVIEDKPISVHTSRNESSSSSVTEGRMKAIVKKRNGGPSVLSIGEVDKPSPRSDEVLVKVMVAGVNRIDCDQRDGSYKPPEGAPETLGVEVAGIIEEVGSEFSDLWKKGDRVCGLVLGGGYAQYCVVHGDMLMEIPDNMSFELAAAIPESFITAYQLLFFYGGLRERVTQYNQTILIHAGASGVGTAAIQLAKLYDNTVIVTTSSTEKMNLCKKVGADYQINYKTSDWVKEVNTITDGKGVDILIDCVGASNFNGDLASMAIDGRLVVYGLLGGSTVNNLDLSLILRKRIHLFGTTLRNREKLYKIVLCQEFFEKTSDFFEEGKLKPILDKTFSFDQVSNAHEYMEENKSMGKIIIKIDH
eukprot:TRINITY_DN486_c0_g2_i1.p1 TRINITY_DN486_c0_g2~~TRINITY_DN486_c0_g2_i1.p1  ORF type:complete len:512 (-),score=149.33 TRINITY_DN486_c0_g2_i1:59-1594(-)